MARKPDYFQRSQFRRYQARRFHNPFFRRPVNKISWRWRLQIILAALIFVGMIYLFAFAPFWMVKNVRVEGLQYMSSAPIKEMANTQLEAHRWLIFRQRHPWFFDEQALKDRLNAAYAFETLEASIEGHVLTISVTERVSEIIWYTENGPFFVDLTGTVIRALSDDESSALTVSGPVIEGPFPLQDRLRALPRIADQGDEDLQPGESVLVTGGVQKIVAMNQALIAQNLTSDHFTVERKTAAWAAAELREGYSVLFDLTNPIEDQIKNLLAVLSQEVKNRATLDYIDVRFGNHVYVQGGE